MDSVGVIHEGSLSVTDVRHEIVVVLFLFCKPRKQGYDELASVWYSART